MKKPSDNTDKGNKKVKRIFSIFTTTLFWLFIIASLFLKLGEARLWQILLLGEEENLPSKLLSKLLVLLYIIASIIAKNGLKIISDKLFGED